MPVTFVDRLPLPSLKVYSATSALLLAAALYHASAETRAAGARGNDTAGAGAARGEPAQRAADVLAYMLQEPLCMWAAINGAYCSLALFGASLRALVFGRLRVAEAQRLKDKFWNYVFYKFIFVFGVLNVQYMDEALPWCSWFTLVGFLHLLGQLCKDRREYLASASVPGAARGAHARLVALLVGVLAGAAALLRAHGAWGLPATRDTFAFMLAECALVLVAALHVLARYALQLQRADAAGALAYYTHLVFESAALVVELLHVLHMVVYSNMLVSLPSLVLLMQLRHLLHELQARVRRHRLYAALADHMSRHYPMASAEEVAKHQDNCAICWEPMQEARKLPCAHLFHNSCLCRWVQQDASCPTCRRALHAPRAAPPRAAPAHPDHLFHFDGSRYVSWLPSFSVEVTRARAVPPAAQLDAMALQVQQMFPHYPLGALVADLAGTRAAELTVDNILEGRLPPPEAVPVPARAPVPDGPARVAPALPPAPARAGSAAPPAAARFPRLASERELTLQRRKELLIAAARRKYLDKLAAARPRAS